MKTKWIKEKRIKIHEGVITEISRFLSNIWLCRRNNGIHAGGMVSFWNENRKGAHEWDGEKDTDEIFELFKTLKIAIYRMKSRQLAVWNVQADCKA